AALDYLSRLNTMFDGDWLLAVAAYNCGEGCVGRAMQRNQQLGLPTDYWNLQLPQETMNYVPKLLALSQIIDSPSLHGTVLPDLANTPYFAEVTIEQQIDLNKAAELANMDTEDFIQLNPAFNQRVTAPQGAYQLLVPVDRAEQFSAALARLPASERVGFQHYQVRSGDTLSQIAGRHQVSVDAIREVNQISGNLINVGQTLMLPRLGSAPMASARPSSITSTASASYRVKPGDNLSSIARQHNLSVNALKQHNNLNSSALQIGQNLRIPGGLTVASAAPAQARSVTYTVKQGDSLYSIARQFNIAIDRIREQNSLGQHLRPGQQLTFLLP
ncbi:MAG: LysM peptidoglycan-binding domain-containing protein, partial [Pseudomonas sp.]